MSVSETRLSEIRVPSPPGPTKVPTAWTSLIGVLSLHAQAQEMLREHERRDGLSTKDRVGKARATDTKPESYLPSPWLPASIIRSDF